jgi:hypothetical protein
MLTGTARAHDHAHLALPRRCRPRQGARPQGQPGRSRQPDKGRDRVVLGGRAERRPRRHGRGRPGVHRPGACHRGRGRASSGAARPAPRDRALRAGARARFATFLEPKGRTLARSPARTPTWRSWPCPSSSSLRRWPSAWALYALQQVVLEEPIAGVTHVRLSHPARWNGGRRRGLIASSVRARASSSSPRATASAMRRHRFSSRLARASRIGTFPRPICAPFATRAGPPGPSPLRPASGTPRVAGASGHVPRNRGDVTAMIGALDVRGARAMMTIEGGTDAECSRPS